MKRIALSPTLFLGVFIRKVLPGVIWVLAAYWVTNSWSDRSSIVEFHGQVMVESWEVSGVSSGTLIDVRAQLFDQVEEGQVLAVLDDSQVLAEIQIARKEIERLSAEVDGLAANLIAAAEEEQADWSADLRRFEIDQEKTRLNRLGLLLDKAQLEAKAQRQDDLLAFGEQRAKVLEERAGLSEKELKRLENLRTMGLATEAQEDAARIEWLQNIDEKMLVLQQADVARGQAGELSKSLAALQQSLDSSLAQIGQAKERLAYFQQTGFDHFPVSNDPRLASLKLGVQVENARVDSLVVRRRALSLRTETAGVVSRIFAQPGQSILPGEPVMTLVKSNPSRILAWLPSSLPAETLMSAEIVVSSGSGRSFPISVLEFGPNFEQLPQLLWRNPAVPEYGRPVILIIGDEAELIAGEPVLVSASIG